ncbi:hypothetical protein [Streptacidiphilus rugosus]|uniref:hypothetical protein n=1 Tax=Streptacidiphilus rugosus TaxID=405783 RepID=UPI0005649CC6|nr:hypothetical protein [Streptacidiphilus rugosus]
MTDSDNPGRRHHATDAALAELVKDSRRAGVNRFQVLALVHRSDDRDHVLLLKPADGQWSPPLAWVQRGETVPDTLDWLCTVNLGLAGWDYAFAASSVWDIPDDGQVLQIAFDVTIPAAGQFTWPGDFRWWHTFAEPPPLHSSARPVLERLFGVPPEA